MSEEKEKTIVEQTVDKVVDTVKESAEKVVDTSKEAVETVKDKVEDVVDAVKAPARSKKATWWNRIWSAIVGAVLAVASMFGITTEQINEQKAKTEEVKNLAGEALEAIKKGDVATAKAALELAAETGKQVVEEAKQVVDNVKEAKAEDVAKTAVEGAKKAIKEEKK
jgi:gas vesicle protein